MITSTRIRATRALLRLDQKKVAELSGVAGLSTERMCPAGGNVHVVITPYAKVLAVLQRSGSNGSGDM